MNHEILEFLGKVPYIKSAFVSSLSKNTLQACRIQKNVFSSQNRCYITISNHISTFIITYYLIYLQPIIAHMDFTCINLDPPSTLVKEEKPPELASVRKDHKIQDCRFRVQNLYTLAPLTVNSVPFCSQATTKYVLFIGINF